MHVCSRKLSMFLSDPAKYDAFASHQRQHGFKLLAEKYGALAAKPYPARALDLGCGTGAITNLIRHFPNFATIIGLDPEPKMLEKAKRTTTDSRISFVSGDACDFKTYPRDSEEGFDLVTAVATIHWWPDVQQGVHNAFRALKPDGHFIGYTWAHEKTSKLEASILKFVPEDPELSKHSDVS